MGSSSAQHAQLQRFPANPLPKAAWPSLLTRWQVQGPWTSSVPWLLSLKLICPAGCWTLGQFGCLHVHPV